MTLAPGTQLGRFVLEQQLGKGAAGVVFLAMDTRLHQRVALKVLHDFLAEDHEVLERFKREIVLTRRIVHAGVCRVHDMHEEDGHTFITMEYVEGQTLAALIHKETRLTPLRTLEVLRGIAGPLDAAHAVGIVHRDLKPGNILVKKDSSICILDFGMATAEDVTRITRAGRTVGSLRFIAPEVWEGAPASPAADRYAIGVVAYACLAGRLPYEASTPAEAFAAQKQAVPSLTEHNTMATPALDVVVRKAMSRKPDDRYPSLAAMAEAFDAAMNAHRPRSVSGTNLVRPRDPNNELNRATPLTGDVFAPPASSGPGVPRPALVAAAVVGFILLAAVIAAIVTAPPPKVAAGDARGDAQADAQGDAGPRRNALVTRPALDDDALDDDARADDAGAVDEVEPPVASATGSTASTTKKSVRSAAKQPSNSTLAFMKTKGLIPGDVPALDAELARARSLERAGKDASGAYDKARAIAAKEVIDRGFITSKQKRLRFASERASAATATKVSVLERESEKLVVARKYVAANECLNRAFALLNPK
jgi:predicted Ser/Thr protein kinase